ncbi:hypothetical protein [Methanococcus maripaludis]|uniref:Uncharacterized protein n=2 Tax=Methanococcus maripaludis TaxID=39152 RepID=A0A7J9S2X5_METMI|nr:hypothetical protein [Methanococcus maripaludis]MBB6067062.1 hypothetical protein [Methanococcus maripaludis]BAP63502.1 hypothetical protein MMOS7_14160 [Methanococcus maripaludis OS7]
MMKVYSLNRISPIFWIFLIPLIIIGLILIIPIIFLAVVLGAIYLGYKKIKSGINGIIRKLKTKKIKIKGSSENGEVKINFSKKLEIVEETLEETIPVISEDVGEKWEHKQFINYLKDNGLSENGEKLYYFDKSVYPIYKKTYPVNEVIKLYDETPKEDMIVLGLKGGYDDPKLLYLIPKEECKSRMSISELKEYEINLKNQEINNLNL